MAYRKAFEYVAAKDGETQDQGVIVFEETDDENAAIKMAEFFIEIVNSYMTSQSAVITWTEIPVPNEKELDQFARKGLPSGDTLMVKSEQGEPASRSLLALMGMLYGDAVAAHLEKQSCRPALNVLVGPETVERFSKLSGVVALVSGAEVVLMSLGTKGHPDPASAGEQPAAEEPQE